jgi:hypothetical protein
MAQRKSQPLTIPPSLEPERASAAIRKQLDALQGLEGRNYAEAEADEQEWMQLTQSIIERAFGNPSTNRDNFFGARSAGERFMVPWGAGIPHAANQRNFEARIAAFKAFLKSSLAELELIMPEKDIQGQYDVGQEYEFYRGIRTILGVATSEVTIVDPYLSTEIFDVYADGINRSIRLRILTNNLAANVLAVANKYATGGNLSLRTTNAIHDRLILIDGRVWFVGQSIKDAAKKKPTYIIEQDGTLVRPIYENIWSSAVVVI